MSDYMQETERLIDAFGRCKWAEGAYDNQGSMGPANTCEAEAEQNRAALLAHIERGRVADGAKPAAWAVSGQDLSDYSLWRNEPDEEQLEILNSQCKDGPVIVRTLLFAAPAAPDHSVAKPATPDEQAVYERIATQYFADTVPAEVPMPEADSECTHSDDHLYPVWNREQMQQYGDAREAAGYARGMADSLEGGV